jgi:hypothetical protein
MLKILASILFVVAVAAAQTTLSGSIGTLTLDSAGSPYTVTDNIIINQGKTLIIGPGCVLLFKPYCGIDVAGELLVQGTPEKPVVFTSINDDKWNRSEKTPEAFDWNGIRILADGRGFLSRFLISYSVYGIQAQSEDITISEGVFNQNGQFNFTLSGKILTVKENLPFSYVGGAAIGKNTRPLRLAAITMCIAGTGCAIGSIPFFHDAVSANRDGNSTHDQAAINAARDHERSASIRAGVLVGSAGMSVVTGAVFWIMDSRKLNAATKIAVVPIIGKGTVGVRTAMNF